jgi:hypothetical protein
MSGDLFTPATESSVIDDLAALISESLGVSDMLDTIAELEARVAELEGGRATSKRGKINPETLEAACALGLDFEGDLTASDGAVLEALARKPGQMVSSEELGAAAGIKPQSVSAVVSRLRSSVKRATINAVRGADGFLLVANTRAGIAASSPYVGPSVSCDARPGGNVARAC